MGPVYARVQYRDGNDWITVTPAFPLPVTATLAPGSSADVNLIEIGGVAVGPANPLYVSEKTPLTAAAPTFATVGTGNAAAVAANASRKGLVLTNTSGAWISLGIGANSAVLYSGISLAPNGGVWVMDGSTFTTGAINAIASAATSNLAVQEFN